MQTNCPECGKSIGTDAMQGLCPECLLKVGIGSQFGAGDPVGPAPGGKSRAFVPPSLEEIGRAFPQLDIIELLGHGGMGAVYKARQRELDRLVALKILPPAVGKDPSFADRFAREAKALARLNHPHIVTLYEFGRTDGGGADETAEVRMAESSPPHAGGETPSQLSTLSSQPLYYFLMEYVDGLNLRQLIGTGRLEPKEALAIVPQICAALQYAHDRGIVHRDIKPENILLNREGTVKIADFGVAKLVGTETAIPPDAPQPPFASVSNLTEGTVIGTRQYMAPEQLENPAEVDHRADIYSLGVVLYQMLTGELPSGKFAPPSKKVIVDVRLDEVVLRALERNPARRYQQAGDVGTMVETIAATPGQRSSTAPLHSGGGFTAPDGPLPWPVIAIAILFIVFGCSQVWETAADLPRRVYNLDLGMLGLPIGIGLLRRRRWWRRAALAGLSIGLAGMAVLILILVGRPGSLVSSTVEGAGFQFKYAASPGWLGFSVSGVFCILMIWMFSVLVRADVRAFFRRRGFVKPWIEWASLGAALLAASAVVFATQTDNDPDVQVERLAGGQESRAGAGNPSAGLSPESAEAEARHVITVALDGTADHSTIQAAIDAAPDRAVIHIGPGRYPENLTVTRPLTLIGAGWQQTIVGLAEPTSASTAEEEKEWKQRLDFGGSDEARERIMEEFNQKFRPPVLRIQNAGFFECFQLQFTQPGTPPHGRLEDRAAVDITGSQVLLDGCAVVGAPGSGVRIANGSSVQVRTTLIAAVWNTGIRVERRGQPCTVRISDSDIRNCHYAGIVIGRGQNAVTVERCRVSGSAWHGIRYDDASPGITGNAIFANARSGIYASGVTAATVRSNIFIGNEMDGISCWFNNRDVIERNTFADNKREAISILGSAEPTIASNLFAGHPVALRQGRISEPGPSAQTLGSPRVEHNLFWNNRTNQVRWVMREDSQFQPELVPAGEDEEAPGFLDPAVGDYSLAIDSPARRAGIGALEPLSRISPWPMQPEELAIIPEGDTRDSRQWKRPREEGSDVR